MTKKNGSKTTSATKEQPEDIQQQDAQPVETVETPDTDTPEDGEGCESVTVIIVHAGSDKQLELVKSSVERNLREVDAEIVVLQLPAESTIEKVLSEKLPEIKTERIVLMDDQMIILNPVTLADIAVIKADAKQNYSPNMPCMMRKSVLLRFIPWKEKELPYATLVNTYFVYIEHAIRPIPVGGWKDDPWVLPVVSVNPSRQSLEKYGEWKKFMYVNPQSWSEELVTFIEDHLNEVQE